MLDSWVSLPMGLLIATVVSTVGIGGGILWMPFLLIVLKLRPDTAVVTSLCIQMAGMGSGTLAYWRQGRVDVRLMLLLLSITVPGIALGAYAARTMPSSYLELILGVLTLATALIFVSANQPYGDRGHHRADLRKVGKYGWFIGTLAVASGMLSVSIGEWLVPILRGKMSMRMTVAVATSVATIFGACILGACFHGIMGGRPDMSSLCWALPGVIIGGQLGPPLAERINDRQLKEVFIFLLTLVGIHLIYNSY